MATKSTPDDMRDQAAVQGTLVAAAKDAQRRNAGQGRDQELQDDVRRKVDYQNSLTPAGAGRGKTYAKGGKIDGIAQRGKTRGRMC